MSHFTDLRRELENYLDGETIEKVHQAYRFAARAHKGQARYSGDPYITHPLAVACILAQMRMDAASIIAAILHDVIEDTPTEKTALTEQFGDEVAELVDGVSKLTQIQFRSREEAQAESFRKMLLAMSKDIRVILVKLADRLHNMRTLEDLPAEKRQRIALETLEIYAPIARRLGMHAFRVEFEDLGFATLYPMRYRILQEAVRKARRRRKSVIEHIETALKECLEKHSLPPSVVWARQRHLYSIFKEMRDEHRSFSEIMDVYTFCIVVDNIDTCYRALGAIHALYRPLPERFRDYIALPKANGYQALHTTLFGPYGVPIEIQIRTVEMDNRADNGIANHWLINPGQAALDQAHIKANEWLKRLLDIQQTTGNSLEFIEDVKIDLFPEEIYVFTPRGKILELPRGTTPVDFAYAIHSDIGNTCIGAKVDRRLVPLSTPLISGQTVEIITSPHAKPNPTWLNFVVTGKAHSNIRHFLKSQRRTEAVALGQRLLENALTGLNIHWDKITKENLAAVLQQHTYKSKEELFEAIGLGNQMAPFIAQHLAKHMQLTLEQPVVSESIHACTPLLIKGSEGMVVSFAECCHPIPGDRVIGILSSGHGITIHMAQCAEVQRFAKQPDKCVPVCWEEEVEGHFKADIRLQVINQQGVLAQLASLIAATQANIDNISVEKQDNQYCLVYFTLSVRDRVHLASVMRRLRTAKSVVRLTRGK